MQFIVEEILLVERNNDSDDRHAWSLVKIDNKWFPMYATWDIITGHISISNLYGNYGIGHSTIIGVDYIAYIPQI